MNAFAIAGVLALTAVVQRPDPQAHIAGTQVVLQAGLDRERQNQNGLAALVAQSILQTPVAGGMTLAKAASANGGEISYAIEPRSVRFYIEGSTSSYGTLLQLFEAAIAHPDFSLATVNAAREALERKIVREQSSALNVAVEMLDSSFYQSSGAGLPRYGLPETLAGLSAGDARAFYDDHYRRGDAVISAAGGIAPGTSVARVVDGLPAGVSPPTSVRASRIPGVSHQIIARRDVPAPWLVAQYHAPPLTSKDFGAMLVLTQFVQRTLADVSEAPSIATASPAEQGVGAFYDFESVPANVVVYVDGGLGDPQRTFGVALGVVNVLGHAKLSGDLTEMKKYAAGRVLDSMQTLRERTLLDAILAGYHVRGDAQTYLLHAIDSTRAADLSRVAAKYLNDPVIALVLPRAQQ